MANPDWDKGLSQPDEQLRLKWVDVDIARKLLYADCDDHTIAAAFDRLRPQSAYPIHRTSPAGRIPLGQLYFDCLHR